MKPNHSIDHQLSILQAAKAGRQIQVLNLKGPEDRWLDVKHTRECCPFNFVHFCYRVKPEPRKVTIWSSPTSKVMWVETAGCSEEIREKMRARGWTPSTFIEQLDENEKL